MVGGASADRRPRLVAVWASMTGVAAVLGNVGGGAAVQLGSWRALFWCVVPLSVAALILVVVFSPAPPRHDRPVSMVSAGLLTAGSLALLSGIVSGPQSGWGSARVLAGFGSAVVLLAAWTGWELRREHPMLDPRLFTVPVVRAGAVGMALAFVGMFGLFYVNGQYLQYAKGYSPLGAGVRLLPMAGALLLAPRCTAALERRAGARVTLGFGLAVLAAGLGTVSLVGPSTPYSLYALGVTLTAAGCGLATPLLSHGMMSALPAHRAGVGSGLQSLVRELGSALGVAVSGSVVAGAFTAGLPAPLRGPGAPTTVTDRRTVPGRSGTDFARPAARRRHGLHGRPRHRDARAGRTGGGGRGAGRRLVPEPTAAGSGRTGRVSAEAGVLTQAGAHMFDRGRNAWPNQGRNRWPTGAGTGGRPRPERVAGPRYGRRPVRSSPPGDKSPPLRTCLNLSCNELWVLVV